MDRFNLDDMSKKFDSKISDEVNKKIDKADLKKNTNLITKKVNIEKTNYLLYISLNP